MSLREAVLQSSVRLAQRSGLEGWSIQGVADGAKCAKALVIHHFKTRNDLLVASGLVIAKLRADRRLGALSSGGTGGLDRLWMALISDVSIGLTAAAFALATHGYPTSRAEDPTTLHRATARCLGISAASLAEPVALTAMLEGIELQLLKTAEPERLRGAFERLWVTMIES